MHRSCYYCFFPQKGSQGISLETQLGSHGAQHKHCGRFFTLIWAWKIGQVWRWKPMVSIKLLYLYWRKFGQKDCGQVQAKMINAPITQTDYELERCSWGRGTVRGRIHTPCNIAAISNFTFEGFWRCSGGSRVLEVDASVGRLLWKMQTKETYHARSKKRQRELWTQCKLYSHIPSATIGYTCTWQKLHKDTHGKQC